MMEKGQGFSWVSEYGSGVESGWTYYLNESSYLCSGRSGVSRVTNGRRGKMVNGRDDDDEDGLSLMSDASSGPPQNEEGQSWSALFWRGRVVVGREGGEDSCFQDTASSAKKNSCISRNDALGFTLLSKEINVRNDPRCHRCLRSSSLESASASKRL